MYRSSAEDARYDEMPVSGRTIIVPVANPAWPFTVNVPHGVICAERAGPYMALTGYRDAMGLSVWLIDLRKDKPDIASTFVLENRFESETRSHSFNSRIGADGKGLIGLATVTRSEESERWWWSASSDLSYLATDTDGKLSKAGDLIAARSGNREPCQLPVRSLLRRLVRQCAADLHRWPGAGAGQFGTYRRRAGERRGDGSPAHRPDGTAALIPVSGIRCCGRRRRGRSGGRRVPA